MKKIISVILCLTFVLFAGCDVVLNAPIDESKQVVNESSEEEISIVEIPDEDDGIFLVSNEEELKNIDFSDYEGIPTICMTAPLSLTENAVFERPINIFYTADSLPQKSQYGIVVVTDETTEIRIKSSTKSLFSSGLLTIDAPECDIVWEGENTPEERDILCFCNVKTFNGKEYNTLGGKGKINIDSISVKEMDTQFSVRGNVITLGFPLSASDKDLKSASLTISTKGASEEKEYDLTKEHNITFTDSQGKQRVFLLKGERISYGVPVMQIYTDGNAPINSKENYVNGKMILDGVEYQMQIRGRGNASWNAFPKKSYRIKLDKGASLFGLPENRDWVLTGNYADKTLIRNAVAHEIASVMDGLEFTSTHFSVNLYINGEYKGVYSFADKIEEGGGRLDFTDIEGDQPNTFGGLDIGFLIEVGWDFDGENVYNRDYFDAKKVIRIYVKEPKSETKNTPEFTYAKQYILAMENAVMTDQNWQDYIDLDAWVDWFIVAELTFNTESCFHRSCYMWKRAGGKLMLGPVWDFDMAFGNHQGDIRNYDGFCTTESTYVYVTENWINYLIKYPAFTSAVKERWNEKKDELLRVALDSVDNQSALLDGSQQYNFELWDIMTQQIGMGNVSPTKYDTYEKQVDYLREFINTRWQYLDERINNEF